MGINFTRSDLQRFVLGATVARRRVKAVEAESALYSAGLTDEEIAARQLAKFNDVWRRAYSSIPFYGRRKRAFDLPDSVSAIGDIADFPVLTKAEIANEYEEIMAEGNFRRYYSTGGSTGTPARFPKGEKDEASIYTANYVVRKWAGVGPGDRYVHVWGHSHLFGAGPARPLRMANRRLKDALVGAVRLNAYDLSDEAAVDYANIVARVDPRYLVGYTSAVARIARAIQRGAIDRAQLKSLRSVTVTAETVAEADIELIEAAFGVRCFVEYGAAEVGIIAQSTQTSRELSVVWNSQLVLRDESSRPIVTNLYDRAFPLICYALDDVIEPAGPSAPVLSISRVFGRTQEFVQLRSSSGEMLEISMIAIVQIAKALSGVKSVQGRVIGEGALEVIYSADESVNESDLRDLLRAELAASFRPVSTESLRFQRVGVPITSLSGKLRLLVES